MKKKMALLLTTMAFVIPFGQISTSFAAVTTGIIKQDRILVSVPSGEVFKNLGFNVSLNNNIVTIKDSAHTVIIKNGKTSFTTDGKTITPDVPQQIINNIFHIPVRAIAESVGAKVSWNAATKTATITYNAKEVNFVWNTPEESTIRGAYKKALANAPAVINGKNSESMKKKEYCLYDIDKDGQPELIINYMEVAEVVGDYVDSVSKVYSFKNGVLYDCGTTEEDSMNSIKLREYNFNDGNGLLMMGYVASAFISHYRLENNKIKLAESGLDYGSSATREYVAEYFGIDDPNSNWESIEKYCPVLKAIAINDTTAIDNIPVSEQIPIIYQAEIKQENSEGQLVNAEKADIDAFIEIINSSYPNGGSYRWMEGQEFNCGDINADFMFIVLGQAFHAESGYYKGYKYNDFMESLNNPEIPSEVKEHFAEYFADLYSGGITEARNSFALEKMNGEKADWFLTNILNTKPNHNLTVETTEGTMEYYNGDYYHIAEGIGLGDAGPEYTLSNYKKLDGNKYLIETTDYNYDGNPLGSSSYTVGLKIVDGKKIWSFYKVSHSYEY